MRINHEELKDLFKHFRWIDNIPEDQNKRDEICVEAKAALLLEANINSEMMPAFLSGAQILHRDYIRTVCLLPSPVTFEAGEYPCFSGTRLSHCIILNMDA